MAPNGSAGCLLQGGDKSLCAGSYRPAGFHPTIARLPANVRHAKHGLEIRRPLTAHLHLLYLMSSGRRGSPHRHTTHTVARRYALSVVMHTLEYWQAHPYSISMDVYRHSEWRGRKTVVTIRQWSLGTERKKAGWNIKRGWNINVILLLNS